MQTLQGIAVSSGVAIGEALVIDNEGFRIPRRFVTRDAVDDELHRLDGAIEAVSAEILQNRRTVTDQLGEQYGAIFAAHEQMLRDPRLRDELELLVRGRNYSAEYAVSRTLRRYAKVFEALDSSYLSERAHDLFDIEKRLLGSLLGQRHEVLSHLASPVVILAHNLTPSETATLDPKLVRGFVTELGGAGGHTAIVAEALEIPAVVGTGRFLADVSGGDLVIVDGDLGRIILQPDEETLERYRRHVDEHEQLAHALAPLRDLPAQTVDGIRIGLHANIEFPREVDACLLRGADGVGLYRTEFLYLGVSTVPTEQTHYEAYAEVVRAMAGRPVVIRTLDLGADKLGRTPKDFEERNPFLGLRSIRLSLRNLPLFRTQLRAVLRASALGDLRLMFPLVTTLQELRQARMVLAELMEDLDEEGIEFNRNLPIGIMVEVPAVITMLDRFLGEVDFISIGTNDLIQYALAVDRGNSEVADLYRACDPAVLRMLKTSLDGARQAEVPAGVCGQMCAVPAYTMLLLGLGLRSLSVPPAAVPEIKKVIRSVSVAQCEAVARRALAMDSAREIEVFLRQELKKTAPELALN
jgi:phosphotransferase system enzyme I (PtsI)